MNIAEPLKGAATVSRLVVRCLGRFRLEDATGNQLHVRTRKTRALIAILALSGRPMSRDALADLLWSDRGQVQARASLRQAIFELQHFQSDDGSILVTGGDDVTVRREHLVTDTELIQRAASDGDWPRLLALLESCEPGLLTDLDGLDQEYDDWLRRERAHEPAKTLATTVDAADRCLAEAGPRAALDLVSGILRLDPLNEEATRLALTIDHQLGDSRALHHHFSTLSERLRDDYDAKPSTETIALFDALSNGGPVTSPKTFDAEAERGKPRAKPSRWRIALMPLVVLAIAAGLLATLVLRNRAQPDAAAPTIVAVLPFDQQPRDNGFIAEGLWEQTRAALTRNTAIRVLGRTTTEVMAQQKLPPVQYLKRLGVTHLLEGSVRRSGSDLLVLVSLTRTSDGITLWQDRFRGRTGEPFALQDAIANGIEGKLRARLAPGGGRRADQIATTPEVYALYSEARQLISSRERQNFRRAEALLRQAVKADPNYAPAWSLLGGAIFFNGRRAIVDASARAEGMAATQRGLSMAPNFAPAHATLALLEGGSSPEAEARLRRAVELDPNYSEAWNWFGNALSSQGRHREAMDAYERAVDLDPLLSPAVGNLSRSASELQDGAAIDRLMHKITKAGASAELVNSLKADQAYDRGDYSTALKLLRDHGVEENGRAKRLMWLSWFESLTAAGYYDALHRVTECPDWYAPMVAGKELPPATFEGKPVTPEEFWTSLFFSAPASRAMIGLGHSRDLVRLYRAGFRSPDDFISETEQRDMLPELSVNVAAALKAQGSNDEASYLLKVTSTHLEQILKRSPSRSASGRLALVRAAQGERTQALALLDAALRRGWMPDGRSIALDLASEPAFRELRGDPRFETARKRILNHVAKERAELGPLRI